MYNFNPEDEAMAEDLIKCLNTAIDDLSDREALVVREVMEYGGQDYLVHLSNILDLTHERCRQIYAKALRKLRHPIRSQDMRDYIDWLNEIS